MAKPGLRQLVLFAGLACSIAAAWWVHGKESDASEVVAAVAHDNAPVPSADADASGTHLPLDRLHHRAPATSDINPFLAKSWFVAPPPPPPPPPPKPTAPPLPFQFMGQFEDPNTGKWVVYLSKGDEAFSVSPGDKFAETYQFDGIEQGKAVIRYLPLSIKQYLPIGL